MHIIQCCACNLHSTMETICLIFIMYYPDALYLLNRTDVVYIKVVHIKEQGDIIQLLAIILLLNVFPLKKECSQYQAS